MLKLSSPAEDFVQLPAEYLNRPVDRAGMIDRGGNLMQDISFASRIL